MARKVVYQGIDIEEVGKITLQDFLKFIPSNSRRTLKRMGAQVKKFIERLRKHDFAKKPMKTHARQMIILPEMLGKKFLVYNGKDWIEVTVLATMLGRRLGEYSIPIKMVRHSGPGVGATRGSKAVELK
ncbi:TPA: 30S ribosomal protein S19 [Candidatus Micrarchaeota archaeon]|nr:ribosomal protein S19 [uncultured archaeon]HIH19714.1 30S ribosomal protein S19 [Candidatus Micrarchaeota archaeon]